eukprot:jgi/Tetstr1/459772/TSEL_005125.t1
MAPKKEPAKDKEDKDDATPAVGNGPPAPVSEDDVMGVGEDPVGEDGMDIDAPAWPPADVEAADEGVIRKGDPGDFYMKVIAKKFRGVWHYGVITGVVTEWVLEDYGGATQWRAVSRTVTLWIFCVQRDFWRNFVTVQGHIGFRAMKQEDRRQALVPIPSNFGRGGGGVPFDFLDLRPSFAVSKKSKGSGKVTVQSGWVMEDCLHHMETCSILNAGPLFEEARNVVTEEDGPERKAQRGAKARRPGQRGAKARRPGQRGAKARRPGQRGAKARRPGERGAKARRPGQRGAKARRPGQHGANASGMGGAAVATE